MPVLVILVMLALAAFLQSFLPGCVWLGQAKVPLLAGLVVHYSLNRRPTTAQTVAVLAGFLQDTLSFIPLGYSSFCFCVAAWVMGRFRGTVLTDAVVTQIFFGVLTAALVNLALYGLLLQQQLLAVPLRAALLKCCGAGLLGGVAAPVMCRLAGRLDWVVGNVQTSQIEVHIGGLG